MSGMSYARIAGNAIPLASLSSAILSSSCCLGPLAFSLTACRAPSALLARLSDYRSDFIAAALLLLVAGFCLSYLPALRRHFSEKQRLALWLTAGLDLFFIFFSRIIVRFL